MSSRTPVQQAVNNLHREGFAVIPIVADSKKAALPWAEFQRRRPTAAELREWFAEGDKNIAIICGSVSGGLVVLDIDDVQLAQRIADDIGLRAETTMVRTPRDGLHVWVIETDGVSWGGPLVAGVADLKAEGGYVLAPPSSIGGREYRVLANTTVKCVPDAREWALGLLRAHDVTVPEEKSKPLSIAKTLKEMAPGNRNTNLFRLACKLRYHGMTIEDIAAFVRQTGRDQGLPDREIEDILGSVSRYPATKGEKAQSGPVLVRLADVRREEVHWRWEHRLPLGKLTVVEGDPEVGKSWLSLAIATAITTGSPLPGDGDAPPPADVLVLTAEDGLGDTVKPRVEDMGGDSRRITVWTAVRDAEGKERHPSLIDDVLALEDVLARGGYSLVIIDPLNAYLGTSLDTHRDSALRSVLTPLAALAERHHVAILGIRHLTKGARDRAIYRGQGSIAYAAAARVVLLVGLNPDDEQERVVACVKNNLAPHPSSVAFELSDGRFLWRGESAVTAAALLSREADESERSALADALEFLRGALSGGSIDQTRVQRDARAAGITDETLRRAKAALKVKSERQGGFGAEGRWVWSLP